MDIYNAKDGVNDYGNSNFGFGAFTAETFFSNTDSINGYEYPYKHDKFLHDTLKDDLGYDIIYLDFESSRANIRKNANYLIKLIQFVNDSLEHNQSDEQIAIMGLGTGGVISRVALREMELQMCCHNTRMLTTFDAPHRGFTFPIGVQNFMEDTYDILWFKRPRNREIEQFYQNVILSPLFSEMLIYNLDSSKMSQHQTFLQYLDEIGMPQGVRNFAVSNGSDGGYEQHIADNDFNPILPGDTIFDYQLKTHAPAVMLNNTNQQGSFLSNLALNRNGNWFIDRAIPFIGGFSSSSNSFVVYKKGVSPNENLIRYLKHLHILYIGNSILIAIPYVADILKASFPPQTPFITIAEVIAMVAVTTATISILNTSIDRNNQRNGADMNSFTNPFPMLSYDNAPGGRYFIPNILSELSEQSLGDIKRPNHNFVSTLSALNIYDDDLRMNVDVNKDDLIKDGKLPFEDYHAAINYQSAVDNELHGLFTIGDQETPGNIPWFIGKLVNTRTASNPSPQSVIVIQAGTTNPTINYGVPNGGSMAPETRLRNMIISDNGVAAVNNFSYPAGLPNQNLPSPSTGSSFSVQTLAPECGGTHCIVDSLGLFQIGEYFATSSASSNTGEVTFLENSTLELLPGSKLVVEDLSRLVIEEGATLIIYPGAEIFLNGASVLEIKGKVELKDSAIFTFTSEEAGNHGYVIFNQRDVDDNGASIPISDHWEIGKNTQFKIESHTIQGTLGMVCQENFRNTGEFEFMSFKNTIVRLAANKSLSIKADSVSIVGVNFDKDPNGAKHAGISFYGMHKNNAYISNSLFKNGYFCVEAHQIGAQYPIKIENSTFEENDTSMVVYHGSFELSSCTLKTSQIGVYSINALGLSLVTNSEFLLPNGIRVDADQSASLNVHNSTFSGDTTLTDWGVGIRCSYTDLRTTCSEFDNYNMGINVAFAMLNLGNLAVNEFSNNQIGIYTTSAKGINLLLGENIFTDNTEDVRGWVLDLNLTPTTVINGEEMINAMHNQYNLQPSLSGHIRNHASFNDSIFIHSVPSGSLPSKCGNGLTIFDLMDPFESILNDTWGVNIPIDYNGVTVMLPEALLLSTGDIYGNEFYEEYLYAALESLENIIYQAENFIESEMGGQEKLALEIAIYKNLDLLKIAYNAGQLEAAAANPEFPMYSYVSALDGYIQTFINSIQGYTTEDDEERAVLNLIRAHVFRLAEHHQEGISVLQNIDGNLSSITQDRIDFWLCVMSWEKDALIGNITQDELYENIISCYLMFNPHILNNDEANNIPYERGSQPNGKLSVYPNPANSHIYIRMKDLAEPDDIIELTVTGMDGRVLYKNKEQASFLIGINVENLPQGAYILTITTPYKKHTGQFLIAR